MVEDEPNFIVVQSTAAPMAQSVYSLSAKYRGQPVWTASGGSGGSRIVFTAMDGKWYVGGDGSQEQGWIRSTGNGVWRHPGLVKAWEVRHGDKWTPDEAVRIYGVPEPDSLVHIEITTSPMMTGWYTKRAPSIWEHPDRYQITDRKGHWCIALDGAIHVATSAPHYGAPPSSSLGWTLLSTGIDERERRVVTEAEKFKQQAEAYRTQAAEFIRLAEQAEDRYRQVMDASRMEKEEREATVTLTRKREAAKIAESALHEAQLAVEKATKTRTGGLESVDGAAKQKAVRDNAMLAARAAEHATEHAKRLRGAEEEEASEERLSQPAQAAGVCAPPSQAASQPAVSAGLSEVQSELGTEPEPMPAPVPTPAPPASMLSEVVSEPGPQELVKGVVINVPGAAILCGRYFPCDDPPHRLTFKDFHIYDNNGYWAVGTRDDISKGIGWLASVQKHGGKPPQDPTLEWRKWVGHEWEGDSSITVTECTI